MQQFLFRPTRSRQASRPRLPLRALCHLDESVKVFAFSDLRNSLDWTSRHVDTLRSVGDFRESTLMWYEPGFECWLRASDFTVCCAGKGLPLPSLERDLPFDHCFDHHHRNCQSVHLPYTVLANRHLPFVYFICARKDSLPYLLTPPS